MTQTQSRAIVSVLHGSRHAVDDVSAIAVFLATIEWRACLLVHTSVPCLMFVLGLNMCCFSRPPLRGVLTCLALGDN